MLRTPSNTPKVMEFISGFITDDVDIVRLREAVHYQRFLPSFGVEFIEVAVPVDTAFANVAKAAQAAFDTVDEFERRRRYPANLTMQLRCALKFAPTCLRSGMFANPGAVAHNLLRNACTRYRHGLHASSSEEEACRPGFLAAVLSCSDMSFDPQTACADGAMYELDAERRDQKQCGVQALRRHLGATNNILTRSVG